MQSSIATVLASADPTKWAKQLQYRQGISPTDVSKVPATEPLLLDTSVYIHTGQAKLPVDILRLVASNPLFHSPISIGELTISLGHMNPSHPKYANDAAVIQGILHKIPENKVVGPSDEAWIEAATIAGVLARTQGYVKEQRRKVWNDALLALTAIERDLTLVSANSNDMDLIQQMKPSLKLALYKQL